MCLDKTKLGGTSLISKRIFEYKGLQIEERICKWDKPNLYKLLWCKTPLEQTVTNGVANPISHAEFTLEHEVPGQEQENGARRSVMRVFLTYWFDAEGKQTQRTIEQYGEWNNQQNDKSNTEMV